jgi:hypothetical protein
MAAIETGLARTFLAIPEAGSFDFYPQVQQRLQAMFSMPTFCRGLHRAGNLIAGT